MLTNGVSMNPRTWKVCPGTNVIVVTADSNPELTAQFLPGCWSLTGNKGELVDKLHWKIDKTTWTSGDVTVTATAGTSTNTIKLIYGCRCQTPLSDAAWTNRFQPYFENLDRCHTCQLGGATPYTIPPGAYQTPGCYNCLAYVVGDSSTWHWDQADLPPKDGILTIFEIRAYLRLKGVQNNDIVAIYGMDWSNITHVSRPLKNMVLSS